MPNVFFVGCTHFFHKNIIKFCPKTRKGKDVEEMNHILTSNWNSQVGPNDVVYHLGDVTWKMNADARILLQSLNGEKHLILGNHDSEGYHKQTGAWDSIQRYLEVKFEEEQKWVLSHFPIYEWNQQHRGAFHLHSHTHGRKLHGMGEGRFLDVGIDNRPDGDMKLWTLEEVRSILSKKPIRNHHEGAEDYEGRDRTGV